MLQALPQIESEKSRAITVRHLRQALLWPLRLILAGIADDDARRRAPWQLLRKIGDASSTPMPCGARPTPSCA